MSARRRPNGKAEVNVGVNVVNLVNVVAWNREAAPFTPK